MRGFHNLSLCESRTYIAANQQDGRPMQPFVRLQEERRTSRRTVADALDVVGQDLAPNEVLRAQIRIGPLRLPSGKCTALVDVVFPDLGYIVHPRLPGLGPLATRAVSVRAIARLCGSRSRAL